MHRINVYSESQAYKTLFFDEELEGHHSQLNKFNLENYIRPNIRYDKVRSEFELEQLLGNVATGIGKRVEQGEKIIDRGEIVTDTIAMKIDSMQKALSSDQSKDNKTIFANVLGQLLYVLMFITLFTIYLVKNNKNYFNKPRNILMLYAMIIIFPIMVSILARQSFLSVYILPLAMVPMLSQVFLDSHTAFITHVCVTMVSALAINDSFVFITIQLVAGLTAIFALSDMSKRAHLFKAAILVFVCSAITHYALQLIQTGKLTLDDKAYMVFFFNGILLLLTYPLMYIIEKAFGFTSNITLFELSDTNKDLLRRLSEVAPGTFQHSITVGNLASEIANRIDANGLLVRTGALYHDIGKMKNPAFYTENQSSVNPHDNLSEERSAQIIIQHVADGLEMADKNRLPADIKGFIATHHGRSKTKYFYVNYVNKHPGEPVNEELFTYPGPNPNTLEQAILMMADSVEAASRSLKIINDDTLRELVGRIIDTQVSEGYFRDCPITFHDIEVAKEQFISSLKTIYHTRISYPELKK